MRIKRYFAPDMRQAIRRVREEQGPDAVILSNRRVEGGVEIVAAVDYDEAAIQRAAPPLAPTLPETPASSGPSPATTPTDKGAAAPASPARRAPQWEQDPALAGMQQEIRALRDLLEDQVAHLAWGALAHNQPQRAGLLRRLTELGLSAALACRLADRAAGADDLDHAWRMALEALAEGLPVGDDDIIERGGVVALVGPTGVGKTTSVAKLAARFALRHGARNVALVSTDNFRIGAHDQLYTYGRILDIPVHTAADGGELDRVLGSLADKRLVLIDTAGMSQRDLRLVQQFEALQSCHVAVRSYLVLAATAGQGVLDETVEAFGKVRLAGCILTKLDEADSLGPAFSTITHSGIPLAWVSDGQQVPEDIHPARPRTLVNRAVSLMQRAPVTVPEERLAQHFRGSLAHA